MLKRAFDFMVSLGCIFVMIPIFLLVSILVLITSGRPVFFKQVRVGRNNKDFIIWKFRTMSVLESAQKGSFDLGNTMRVTPIGKILRKTKLDELPQLFNVLNGQMSLVGPRPEIRKWVNFYPVRWEKALSVAPGITDRASIEFRNEEELLAHAEEPEAFYRDVILPKKLDYYEAYAEHHSFWRDISIILKTIVVVIKK